MFVQLFLHVSFCGKIKSERIGRKLKQKNPAKVLPEKNLWLLPQKCYTSHMCKSDNHEDKNSPHYLFSKFRVFFSYDIEYCNKIKIVFVVLLGVFSLATKVDGKKVPDFIKKLNKFLGLPSKSDSILDILKIPVIEKNQKKMLSHLNIN